ncbi:MAG: hypothetical protein RL215_166 [Planctomycetota bacterium]
MGIKTLILGEIPPVGVLTLMEKFRPFANAHEHWEADDVQFTELLRELLKCAVLGVFSGHAVVLYQQHWLRRLFWLCQARWFFCLLTDRMPPGDSPMVVGHLRLRLRGGIADAGVVVAGIVVGVWHPKWTAPCSKVR